MSRIFGFVHQNTNGQNHGPIWKIWSFIQSEICAVIFWQDRCGKGNLWKSYSNTVGRKVQIGNVSLYIVKKGYSYLCMWVTWNWLERNKKLIPMWKVLKEVDLGEPTSFLDHVFLGLHSKTMRNKQRYCGQLQNHVRIANSSGESREITIPFKILRISSWSYDMAGHAKKCVERYCELANKTTQQLYKVSTSMHRWTIASKTQSFFLSAGLLWERTVWGSSSGTRDGKSTELGLSVSSAKTKIILIGKCGWQKMTGRKANVSPMWKKLMKAGWSRRTDIDQSLTTCTWDALNGNAIRSKVFLRNTERCSNHESCQSNWKRYLAGKCCTRQQSLGLLIWKDMQRNAWKDVANWLIKRLSNCMRSLHHAWRPSLQKGRIWSGPLQNEQKMALHALLKRARTQTARATTTPGRRAEQLSSLERWWR